MRVWVDNDSGIIQTKKPDLPDSDDLFQEYELPDTITIKSHDLGGLMLIMELLDEYKVK